MKKENKDKIEMKDIETNSNENNQNTENNLLKTDTNKENTKISNIYFIFTIDKNIFEKNQIKFEIIYKELRTFKKSENTELIKYDEFKNIKSKILMINQLYCISFIQPKEKEEVNIYLHIRLRDDLNPIKSFKITVPKKEYVFLYEHSFEDLNKNHPNNIKRIKIIQTQLDLQQKFSYFLRKLNIEESDNKNLIISFIQDTFKQIKKENMPYNIIFNLLQMSYKKTNLFYIILEEIYNNQKIIYFPNSVNVKKFKPFVELITNEKNDLIDFEKNEQFNEEKKKKITLYLKIFKEIFYRKYDKEDYIKLSQEKEFLEIIKQQIISNAITREDKISPKIINNLVNIINNVKEIKNLFKFYILLSEILNFIIDNFQKLNSIYTKTNNIINLANICQKIEENNLKDIKKLHEKILELEQKNKNFFIDFGKIIKQYMTHFSLYNLNNLIILREMIMNQSKYGQPLEDFDDEINNIIHETGITIASNLKSNEIVNFIIDIDKKNYKKKDLNIVESINIYELSEKEMINFSAIWGRINKEDFGELIRIIFRKISSMKDIGLIFKLIPNVIFDFETVRFLELKFKSLFNSYNEDICPNIIVDISNILLAFYITKYSSDDFFNFIENNLSKKKLIDLYIHFIKEKNLSELDFIKRRIITFFTQKKIIINNADLMIYILENINASNNNTFINEFLDSLDKFIIVKEDFFDKKNNKFKLYISVVNIFLKNKMSFKNTYFLKSNETIRILKEKVNSFEFNYNEVMQLKEQIEQNYLEDKLIILNNNSKDIKFIYNQLKENVKRFDNYYNELLMTQNFFILFFGNSEKDFISDITNKINNLNGKNTFNNFNNLQDFFNNDIKYNMAKKYNKLRFSKIFIGLLNNYKKNSKESEIQIFNNSVKNFCELQILNIWTNNYSINEIPHLKILSEGIENIIKENNEDKKKCIILIHKELNIINYTYEHEVNKPEIKKDISINAGPISGEINNNIPEINLEEDEEIELNDYDENVILYNDDNSEKIFIDNKNSSKNVNAHKNNYNIEKNLIYLPFLNTLKKILFSIKILIELFGVQKTVFYEEIGKHYNKFKAKNGSLTFQEIKENIVFLKNFRKMDINIVSFNKNDNSSILIDFLTLLSNNVEGIKFAIGKRNEEIRALSEFVGESENSKIQIKDIQDFMNVCIFFENIRALNLKYDFNLIEEFKAAFATMPSFGNSFSNYLNNFKEIKNVYEEYLDKPEVSRKKIEQILKFSNITIYFDNNSRLIQIMGVYTDILNNDKTFNNNDLQELHDRALLFSNKTFDDMAYNVIEKKEEKSQNSKNFVEIVEDINVLVTYLTSLYIKGYPKSIKVEIKIDNSIARDNEGNNIKDLIKNYKSLTTHLEDAQTKAYKEKHLISLIYGQQFYDIYNYLTNKNINIDIIPLLKKLSDNKIIKIPNILNKNYHFENKFNFTPMIEAINDFLNECLLINKIELSDLYKKNIIKNEFRGKIKPGFYTWNVDEMNFEIQIISVYKKLTGNLPLSITLLLCTRETNEEEITSFIYRAILCPYPVLFIIINSENLELSNAQYFIWILEKLYNLYQSNMKSSLLILFGDIDSILKMQLPLLNGHEYFITSHYDINEVKNDYESNPIKVWTSDIAGVGKSEKIKYEAEKLNLKYIYFPIGGTFNRKELINRIVKLDINKNNYSNNYLHIDIYDSDKESSAIIKEFLFSLLITRNYSYDEKIFYLGYGTKISIEIPTGFYNMEDKFKLLNYFTTEKLSLEHMPELREIENKDKDENNNNIQKKKITDIQLVTNILKMLDDNTIKNKVFDLEKEYEKIPMIECQNTINKYFTLEKGNYYQKMAFIHILADQFKKFCSCFYLDPDTLIKNIYAKADRLNNPFKGQKIREFNDVKRILENIGEFKKIFDRNDEQNIKKSREITEVRKIMIENLIKLTLYFVKGPYNKIALNQKKTNSQLFGEFDEKKINEIANESLSNKDEIISFEKINPSLVFFNEDIQTFSIITTSKRGEDEYNQLLKLFNSQSYSEYEQISLINYRTLTHEEFLPEVKNILNLNTLSIEQIKNIIGSYCFTSDNFIKMILILLRTRAGIPVVMMGETGCGKTSLIKILSTLLNKGNMNLKIMNIHAGIKDQDIIDFIEKVNNEVNNINDNSNEKQWVFFDEINTCNSMGLLSEIFYKHSYYGKKLNKKLTFIAACNPYRLKLINKDKKNQNEDDFCLDFGDYQNKQKLVYLVNPLPHSLLTSIFDFGNLSPNDEKKYIKSIVKETINKYNIDKSIETKIVNQILVCHNYIRENNDVSSVSLRELRRFNILFDFFVEYLNSRINDDKNEKNNIYINSLCLSLYFCYYIRLSNNKLRSELKTKIKDNFKNKKYFDIIQKEKQFISSQVKIPPGIAKNSTLLENIFSLFVCIVNKIPLIICGKPGTSKSLSFQILYDNMKGNRSESDFFKKYPELLVFSYQGSKTSTSEGIKKVFNKARNCLKKNNQNNNNQQIKNNINAKVIPVVYFDEMGLAEESPNNPLKVIHSELEYDDNELKIAFVGISNWRLDASKMNRTIFLGVPPLEEKDLLDTADEISSNLDKEISLNYKDLFINLVKTYCKYKKEMKDTNQSEFHGLRDFYHLIKNAMHYLIKEKPQPTNTINLNGMHSIIEEDENNIDINEKSYKIGIKSLLRNFDGLKKPFNTFNSYDKIKIIFDGFYKEYANNYNNHSFNVFECLKDNIADSNSRYLLIIMESSMSLHLLSSIMQNLNKKYIFYSGSQLKEDVNQEKYNEKLLNKIQLSLENGDVLVLKNMENIYPSLYNLFNQNFTMLGGKKFARIAFANYKSYSVVHNDFRAIVLVDEKQIKEKLEDPPFLNRFEKHSFSFEYLMNKDEIKITNEIIKYLDLIISYNKKKIKIDLKKQILWYNKEEIKGLVFKENYKLKNNKEKKVNEDQINVYDNVLKNLSKLFSQDILASIISIDSDLKGKKMPKDFLNYYALNHYYNFKELINSKNLFVQGENSKLIIYTFSKLLEPCIKSEINTVFGILNQNNISEKIINSIKNEIDLEGILDDYFKDEEKKFLILKFCEEDLNKMNQIKLKINQFEIEKKNHERYKNIIIKKHFIFLICLTRQKIDKNKSDKNKKLENKIMINDLISNIDEEYSQFFIDNLHGKKDSNITNIMAKTTSEYINNIFYGKTNLLKLFHRIFSYLTYEYKNEKKVEKKDKKINEKKEEKNEDKYIEEIIYKLSKNEYLLNLIKEKIEKQFGGNINEIINYIFIRGAFDKNDIEFIDIIYKVINDKVFHLLFKFIFKSEKDHFLRPFLLNYDFINQEKKNLIYIQKYINDFDFSLVNVIERINSNQILLILKLNLPLSKKWYDLINRFIENNIKENYMNNEENLRTSLFEENQIDKELDKYWKNKNDYIDNVKGELLRIDGLNDLLKSKNINYIKKIYFDFMSVYLAKKFKYNIEIGIQFLDILIQIELNNKDSFLDKKRINLQDSFINILNNNNNEELNIKYDEETLSKILLFLICYNDEIYLMLEIFYALHNYVDSFFNEWKEIISQKEIKYEINQNSPRYTKEVNESFFVIYESLIKCIFINPDKYLKIREDLFYEYLDSIKKLSKTAIQIYYKLYLPSKEMYNLQILINIFSSFDSCKNKGAIYNIQDIFIQIINMICNENYYIINKMYQGLEENFETLQTMLDILINKEKDVKEYSFLLNNLFIYRFNKSMDKEYRKNISIIFFNKITNSQLIYILPILKKLIDDIEPKIIDEDFSEKDCVNNFLNKFINVDNDYLELYKIINSKNIDVLDLNILYYFECECDLYFKKLSNGMNLNKIEEKKAIEYMNNILLNLSLKYFKKAMSYYLDNKEFNIEVKKLGKIYCIAYIKNYLKRLSEFITYNKDKNILNFEEIINVLLQRNADNRIFTLKIFLFKCLYNNENKNYFKLIESMKNKRVFLKLLNHDDFEKLFSIYENKHSYNYSFININTFQYYNNLNNLIDMSLDNFDKNKDFNPILNFVKNNKGQGFELIFNILINKYIFDLYGKEVNNNENLSANANIVFNKFNRLNINLKDNTQTIINYLINKNLFTSKILPKLKLGNKNLTTDHLYILFFCIRNVLSLQCFDNIFFLFYIDKNFKSSLLDFLNENFIPGAFPLQNEFIDSYYDIEKHIRTQPPDSAIYICSCGRYYNILPCGYPVKRSKCLKCKKTIGGLNHFLERRPGHYRIFLNERIKDQEFKKMFADTTMPYKYLDEFKRDVIDPLLKKPNKGIGKMTKEIINKTGNNIRNIDELSFRILNFILCSHLLVANILDILDDNDISKFFSEETSCFGIIMDNWNKIVELLNKKGINNIQIFMNIIFEDIINIIKKYEINALNTSEGRNKLENEINTFITGNNEINDKIKKYENQNQQILNSSPENISSLIQELYPREFYNNENKYPYFKYLYYYEYPNINSLYNIIESNNNFKNQYPLTYNVLKNKVDNNKDIEKLKYIPKINKKLNHLIQNYSYKISRDDALKKTIKDEYNKADNNLFIININKNNRKENVKSYIKDIVDLFNKFKNVELQWGCHKLQNMELSEESKLATILLDDNEPGYYLSSIYKKLIEYQNIFLDNIINCNTQNGLLHCFEKQLNNEIMIQDASINEIVKFNFEENYNNNLKLYSNLDELININTTNDISINKYNFELDQIEIELGNIILPGVRKFKPSDDELRFITYMFEGYRGKNSNILTNFNEKYPPQELTNKEKKILNKYIKNNENDDYKTFLFSLQLLIDYIQKSGKDKDIPLSKIINNIPEHINIDEKVKVFFNNRNEFTVNKLVRIFELFEHLCWEQIKDNLLDEFMRPIDEDKKKLIYNKAFFKDDKKYNIKKVELASAIRKFISRYIAGKRSQSEINEDKMLFDYLNRVDLWARNIDDDPDFEKEYFELSSLKITVGEGKDFYDILGGDSQLLNLNIEEKNIKQIENIELDEITKNQNRIIIDNENNDINNDINTQSNNNIKRNKIKEDEEEDENQNYTSRKKPKRKLF